MKCWYKMGMDIKTVQVELQSLGVRVPESCSGRRGGAGPSEGQVIILAGHAVSVPTQSAYVLKSPYALLQRGTSFMLSKDEREIAEVLLPAKPRYYDLRTPREVSFDKIALTHGTECLASTVYQDCLYWKTSAGCSFCGIGLSLAGNSTILEKDPEDLGLVAEHAVRLDAVTHVTLTTGMRVSEKAVIKHLSACAQAIKQRTSLPVHVQICPPGDLADLDVLRQAGADTIGIHIETFDAAVLRRVAPAKAGCGLEPYIQAWKHAVAAFGKNQVSSFLIAGLGEEPASILSGAELLCGLGVFPYLLPFRPIPGTPLAETKPPAPETMYSLYEQVGAMVRGCGLSSKSCTAGCVRCGACSALALFE